MLSSHNMGAIEEMCSTIALVNKGNLLLKGELSDIKDRYRTGKLILTTRRPISVSLLDDSGLIETIDQTEPLRGRKGYAYVIQKKEEVKNNQLLDAVSIQGEVIHFEEHLPSLNDIFLQIVNEGPEKLDLQQNNQ